MLDSENAVICVQCHDCDGGGHYSQSTEPRYNLQSSHTTFPLVIPVERTWSSTQYWFDFKEFIIVVACSECAWHCSVIFIFQSCRIPEQVVMKLLGTQSNLESLAFFKKADRLEVSRRADNCRTYCFMFMSLCSLFAQCHIFLTLCIMFYVSLLSLLISYAVPSMPFLVKLLSLKVFLTGQYSPTGETRAQIFSGGTEKLTTVHFHLTSWTTGKITDCMDTHRSNYVTYEHQFC